MAKSSQDSDRFSKFSHSEMLWIALALALAKVQCAEGDDQELAKLFDEACGAIPAKRVN